MRLALGIDVNLLLPLLLMTTFRPMSTVAYVLRPQLPCIVRRGASTPEHLPGTLSAAPCHGHKLIFVLPCLAVVAACKHLLDSSRASIIQSAGQRLACIYVIIFSAV